MQIAYLTYVMSNEVSGKKTFHGNIIKIIPNKIFPIQQLKEVQIRYITTSLVDSINYIDSWRSGFKYLVPNCCGNNFCLIVSDYKDTLLSNKIGWEVTNDSIETSIKKSWELLFPPQLISRDCINFLTVRQHG